MPLSLSLSFSLFLSPPLSHSTYLSLELKLSSFPSFNSLGYGSCEVAGDDVVALSYVIAATRPAGGVLLTLLFLALLKPIVIGLF